MDIYSFVNSKDIREHLRKIEYQFNSLETAWLIYSCHDLSYEQKKEAWMELIQTMPDCEVPKRDNCRGWNSLHVMLRKYMDTVDKEVSDFFENDSSGEYVYMYFVLYEGDECWTEEDAIVYSSLDDCLKGYKEEVSQSASDVIKYKIRKQSLINKKMTCEVEFKANGGIECILQYYLRDEEADDLMWHSFNGLGFSFPTPFKKGDIVWIPTDDSFIRWDRDGGFVLDRLSSWYEPQYIMYPNDYLDMDAYGYFVNPDGTVYHEVISNYMDLEYYQGPYKLNEKILPALSKFIKGEIEVDFLLCAYRKVLLDVAADDIMLKSWYTKEMLEGIGLR